jgi:3-phosphoshikimate 1-carboxyvinyltransferase
MPFPDRLEILPLVRPPRAAVRVPGSKSITNRALVLAALSAPPVGCELTNVLHSEDTEVMVESLRRLGCRVDVDWQAGMARVHQAPSGVREADLFVANSGTSMRFLAAMISLFPGRCRLDGVPRMRERPIGDLLDALRQLGVDARSEGYNGCPPVVIESAGWKPATVTVRGDTSSQFLSALLLAAPFAGEEITIRVEGPLVSAPYIEMTLALLRDFGAKVDVGPRGYRVDAQQPCGLQRYAVEPDASAASYFFAAAAITGGSVTVPELTMQSLQGDVRFVELLEVMGCTVRREASGITVQGGRLRGIEADMNDISDTVMTLAAVACFAAGPTTIRNVAHIRHKETDRLAALATELRRIGMTVEDLPDGLRIVPCSLRGAEIETYDDHRMAMSLALVGLRVSGIVIKNPGCVGKTYPGFFADLERLRVT